MPPRERTAAMLAAGLLLLIAIVPRAVVPWRGVVESGAAIVRDPDACYHLRRADRIARGFPDLALLDSYVNFPHGARVIWPPLYDVGLAALLRAFPAPPNAAGPSAAVALLPPILFGGAIAALFRLARRIWPRDLPIAALAAGLPALLPANVPVAALGQLDHHAAELFLITLFLAALAGASARVRDGASPLRNALAPGAALGAALLVQLTLVLLIAVPMAAVVISWRSRDDSRRGRAAAALELAAWTAAAALVVVLPWALTYAVSGAPLRHFQFGLFQPALLALAAAAAVAARAAVAPTGRAPRSALLVGGAAVAIALLALLAREIVAGLGFAAAAAAPWQSTIGESRSIFALGAGRGIRDLARGLSALVVLAPIGLVLLFRKARAGESSRSVIVAAAILFVPLGAFQARFLPHASLVVGFAVAECAAGAVAAYRSRRGASGRARAPLAIASAASLVLALALWPTIPAWRARDDAAIAFDRARSTLEFLEGETPPTADPGTRSAPPGYGVLAEWSYGHFIQYYGCRPAVVDNFGFAAGDPAKVRDFFLATEEAPALAFLDSLRVGYVLVGDLAATFYGTIPDRAAAARYVDAATVGPDGRGALRFTPAIVPTLAYRLAWLSGGGAPRGVGGFVPPLAHLRLVAESAECESIPGGGSAPYVKLYERVAGARLAVRGLAPGQRGALLATIRSPRGRRFPYALPLAADASGTIGVAFPYPTIGGSDAAAGAERCAIDLGDRVVEFPAISEDAVRGGSEVEGIALR